MNRTAVHSNTQHQEAILNGPYFPTLFKLALPIICGNIFQQLYNIVDALCVGRLLGNLPLSGISAAAPVMDLIYGLMTGSTIGIGVLIGRLAGAGEREKLKRVHAAALVCGGCFALLLMLAGFLTVRPILQAEGTAEATIREALRYMNIICGGLLLNYLYCYYASLLRSLGDSRTPFIVLLCCSSLHALLDLLLLKMTSLGIIAVALSTVFCQLLSAVLLMSHVHRRLPELSLKQGEFGVTLPIARELLSYAWATAVASTVVTLGKLLVQGMLTSLGTDTVTGYNMGMRFEGFSQAISQGISGGTVICMAQNLGAGNNERLKRFFRAGLLSNISYSAVLSLCCGLLPRQIIHLFSDTESVIAAGAEFVALMAFFYPISLVGEMLQGYFRGVGRLRITMLASGISIFLRVCLSAVLIPRFGVPGICWSCAVGWVFLVAVEGRLCLSDIRKRRR